MRGYVRHFFGCDMCRTHFLSLTEARQTTRSNPSPSPSPSSGPSPSPTPNPYPYPYPHP